jgi:DNA repair exonuclease SbcCD ATPase subunit
MPGWLAAGKRFGWHVLPVVRKTDGKVPRKEDALMDTTETMLNKPAEHSDLPEQQAPDVTENNNSKTDTPTAAQKDASDILAILDSFGEQQTTTDRLPDDALLNTEEQDKLANLLKDTKPKSETENKDEQTDFLQVEVTENKGDLDKTQNKTYPDEQEQNKLDDLPVETQSKFEVVTDEHETLGREIDGLLNKIQSQLEAVITEHDTLSRELILTRARVEELENNQPDDKAEKPNRTIGNEDIGHLRLKLTNITKWHKSLTVLVQKLLKLAENSNAERETLEADLIQAHETIGDLNKKVQPLQEELEDYDNIVTDLRTQLVNQAAMLTTTHEKLLHEVSQRRETEQMLRKIKSRFVPLTRTRATTKYIS